MSSSTDIAYDFIREAVMSGALKPGDRVKEELIAEQIGVSRTPIRSAMQKLAAQGYIEMLHHKGARVADWGPQDLDEITELRALLEAFGARIAAGKIAGDQLIELRDLADRMEAAVDVGDSEGLAALTSLNSEFHMRIIEASGNRRLAEVIGNLAHPLLIQRRFSTFSRDKLDRSMRHHRELLDALEAGNGEWASAVMRAHILSSS